MHKLSILLLTLTTILFLTPLTSSGQISDQEVLVIELDGTISAMAVELMREALKSAEMEGQIIVLTLNTPGGSLDSTFQIIELIENARVPVVGYVAPEGARAWSAGTYILLSTHIAAMAPHCIIGSGQPVSLSPLGSEPIEDSKVINALKAYLAEKANMHGRNQTAAELFITENLNLNSEEALRYGVVEYVAPTINDLLLMIDSITVSTGYGEFKIQSDDTRVKEWSPSLRVLVLKTISEPTIALLLLIIGLYALIFGLTSPGVGGEIVGAICLVLGLIGIGMIKDINLGALILIGLGAALLLFELYTPSFGIAGGSGIACAVIGSLFLFPRQWIVSQEWLNTLFATSIIIPLCIGGFFIFTAYKVLKARRKPPFLGRISGEEAEVIEEIDPQKVGFVIYQSEYWKAKSDRLIKPKSKVLIKGKEGPVLIVEPREDEPRAPKDK